MFESTYLKGFMHLSSLHVWHYGDCSWVNPVELSLALFGVFIGAGWSQLPFILFYWCFDIPCFWKFLLDVEVMSLFTFLKLFPNFWSNIKYSRYFLWVGIIATAIVFLFGVPEMFSYFHSRQTCLLKTVFIP